MTKPDSAKSLPTLEEAFARYVLARRRNSPRPVQGQRADDPAGAKSLRDGCGTSLTCDNNRTGHEADGDQIPGTADVSGCVGSPNAVPLRHDEPMPWKVHHVVALPASIDEALEVVKTGLRVQIAHYLANHPAARIGEIIGAVGGERATVRANLSALEELGVVAASLPAGQREAQRVLYSLNRTRWTEMIIRVITYLPAAPEEYSMRDSISQIRR